MCSSDLCRLEESVPHLPAPELLRVLGEEGGDTYDEFTTLIVDVLLQRSLKWMSDVENSVCLDYERT